MQTDAMPFLIEGASEPQRRRAAARDRRDVSAFDKLEIGRDADPSINSAAGFGTAVIESAWLAFYVITALRNVIASVAG